MPSGECTVLRTGQLVETQDVFFWRLAGRSAPTGLAIVHWIGSINAIKKHKMQNNTAEIWIMLVKSFFIKSFLEIKSNK